MAISPTIPTSFVPRQPVQAPKRRMVSGNNPFLIISLGIAGLMLAASAGVFLYGQYLKHVRDADSKALESAQKNVKQEEITQFIRLRDRLTSAKSMLTSHVELSQLFDVLESITLQNVRYTSLKIVVAGDHSAQLTILGQAKNFNSLASQSDAMAGEKRIKRAIFSGIQLSKNGTVAFTLTADIDASLVKTNGTVSTLNSAAASSASTLPATPGTSTPAQKPESALTPPTVSAHIKTTAPSSTTTQRNAVTTP